MKKLISLLMASLMVLSLAACGGTGSGTSPSTDTATPTPAAETTADPVSSYVQGVTDTEVLVANSAATSGALAPVGVPFIAGIEAYFKMVNESGGMDGRNIRLLHEDDEFDPVKGKAALQNYVEDEKVFALVGHFGTPVVGATIEDIKEYGIPAVYFATGIGQLYAEDAQTNEDGYNLFPVQPIYKTEGQIIVARAVGNLGAQKIGVIYSSDDAGKDILWGCEAMAEELGIELVVEQIAAGASDVSAVVTSIKNAGVDVVVGACIQATIPTVIKELAAQEVNKDVITTYVNVSVEIADQVADAIAGKFDVYGSNYQNFDGDQAEAQALYEKWIDAEFAQNTHAHAGWIAGHFLSEGLRRCEGKELTWASYMEGLESGPIQNPFGGKINYANGQRMGTQEMVFSKMNTENACGWEVVSPLQSIDSILSN